MSARIIHVLCEGQTEQGFVEEVLSPYLRAHGADAVKSVLLTTNRKLNVRGGMLSYNQVCRDIDILKRTIVDGDFEHHVITTMFDLYALPDDFPGYADAMKIADRYARVSYLEHSFAEVVGDVRFVPYIQLHEFEALVLCGINYVLDMYPGCEKGCASLLEVLKKQPNPELINDNPHTAPSKRIINVVELCPTVHYRYNKPRTGKYVTGKLGIEQLRKQCPHFNQWIDNLIIS